MEFYSIDMDCFSHPSGGTESNVIIFDVQSWT